MKRILLFVLLLNSLAFGALELRNMPDGGEYSYTTDEIVTIKTILRSNKDADLKKQILFPKSADYKILRQNFGGTSANTSISYVNGQMTKIVDKSSIYYTQIKFNKNGIFTVKSPKVMTDNGEIVGNDIKISIGKQVVSQEDENENTPNFWFYVKSSKVHTVIGEQIILTIEFGPRTDVQLSSLNLPDLKQIKTELSKKFITQELFKTNEDIEKSLSQKEVNGAIYNLYSLKYVLYPYQKGSINLGPYDINYGAIVQVRRGNNNDPFSMFFNSRKEKKAIKESNLWSIYITEKDYTAGKYSIKNSFSADSVAVGEPITIAVDIVGKGNIKSLGLPDYSSSKDFVTYSPEVSYSNNETTTSVTNKVKIKYLLIPKFMGEFTIPQKSIKYYNSTKKRLDSLVIPSKTIKVGNNDANSNQSQFASGGITNPNTTSSPSLGTSQTVAPKVVTTEKEISYISKDINIYPNKFLDFITNSKTLITVFILNILILLWAFIYAIFVNFISRSAKAKLLSNIKSKADITKIKSLTENYLAEKSNGKFKGISFDEIKFSAISHNFTLLKDLTEIIEKFDADKYSYNATNSTYLKDYVNTADFKKLIINLDKDEKWAKL